MCCPIYDRLNHDHVAVLNEMRSAPSWADAIACKCTAQVAWSAIVEHRRTCPKCRVRSTEALSSTGMPAWQTGLY